MNNKLTYIINILNTTNNNIMQTSEYIDFINSIKNLSTDEKINKFSEIVLTNSEHESIVNNCKLILLNKATSGITGSTNEKNINYIYDLLKKNLDNNNIENNEF